MDGEYLSRRHEGFQAPERQVFDLVERATGVPAHSRTKITVGYDNEVYRVGLDGGLDVIVRIHRDGDVAPRQERWAIERCQDAGVPVPRVLLVDDIDLPDGQYEAMVQECAAGRPLSEVATDLSDAEWADVCRATGDLLQRIHSIPVDGYYRLNPDWTWDFPDLEAIKRSSLNGRASEQGRLAQCGFTDDECRRMLELQRTRWQNPRWRTPVLCHGDFLAEHLFVGDGPRITAVIDFGDFQGGHPSVDLTQLSFWSRPVDEGAFSLGYGAPRWFGAEHSVRRALVRLEYLMGYCAHLVHDERREEREFYSGQLRETLELLDAELTR